MLVIMAGTFSSIRIVMLHGDESTWLNGEQVLLADNSAASNDDSVLGWIDLLCASQTDTSQSFRNTPVVDYVGGNNSSGGITPRRMSAQNIVYRLRAREMHVSKPGAQFHVARSFHTNVFPNYTVISVEKPPCFLRKFSPDGRYFIAFSADQMSLEIYEFRGPAAAEDMFENMSGDYLTELTDPASVRARSQLFGRFFRLKQVTSVAVNGESLNRECSLFTDDGRYVVVGSAAYVPDDPHPHFYDMYRNNESVSPNPRSPLEDYTLHLVELETGRLCDSRQFRCDKIFLSHNQGLYLYRDTLAVLSVQQQTIHIFQVTADGMFVDVRSIGRLCYDDDLFLLSAVRQQPNASAAPAPDHPYKDRTINCLKHRLLVYLYRRACAQANQCESPAPILQFYRYFDEFCRLRMWKMQLLDENHLLIKYASEDIATLRLTDPNSQPAFFVVYNMSSARLLAIYENTSDELLGLFENFCDLFRNATLHCEAQFTCSASSNVHARQIHQRFKQTIVNAKFGGQTEAVKRLLAQLPISAQSYSSSPYLDLSLFSYDDKWVSVMERPKACGDHPIRPVDSSI